MVYEKQDARGPRPKGLGKRLDSLPNIGEVEDTFEKSGALEDGLYGNLNQLESSRNNYNYRTP